MRGGTVPVPCKAGLPDKLSMQVFRAVPHRAGTEPARIWTGFPGYGRESEVS